MNHTTTTVLSGREHHTHLQHITWNHSCVIVGNDGEDAMIARQYLMKAREQQQTMLQLSGRFQNVRSATKIVYCYCCESCSGLRDCDCVDCAEKERL